MDLQTFAEGFLWENNHSQIDFRKSEEIREPTLIEANVTDFQLHLESIPILKFASFAEIDKDLVVVK